MATLAAGISNSLFSVALFVFALYLVEVECKGQAETWSKGCNIPKILIQLCLNEANIHKVKYPDNLAMRSLRVDNKTKRWTLSRCQKIVFLDDLSKNVWLRSGCILLK